MGPRSNPGLRTITSTCLLWTVCTWCLGRPRTGRLLRLTCVVAMWLGGWISLRTVWLATDPFDLSLFMMFSCLWLRLKSMFCMVRNLFRWAGNAMCRLWTDSSGVVATFRFFRGLEYCVVCCLVGRRLGR